MVSVLVAASKVKLITKKKARNYSTLEPLPPAKDQEQKESKLARVNNDTDGSKEKHEQERHETQEQKSAGFPATREPRRKKRRTHTGGIA